MPWELFIPLNPFVAFVRVSHDTHQSVCVPWEDLVMHERRAQGRKRSVKQTKTFGCGQEHLWNTMVTCDTKGSHTLLVLERLKKTWVAFGQGRNSLWQILDKSGKHRSMEACVRQNQNLRSMWK
jgi:hypothetical protein